jgi:hypothetical protein
MRTLAAVALIAVWPGCDGDDQRQTPKQDLGAAVADAGQHSDGAATPDQAPTSDALTADTGLDQSLTKADAASGSCAPGSRAHATTLKVLSVDPQATDPKIRAGDSPHLYVEPAPAAAGKLFVFFPGSGAKPDYYKLVIQNAAAGGYHAIGLSYVNDDAIIKLCSGTNDPTCQEDIRNEVLFGVDTSKRVDVDAANSIENRLVKLLMHLKWSAYLSQGKPQGAPKWSLIAVAGHSQGGGHAAFVAKHFKVHRSVLFAATEPAGWTQTSLATPVDRLFGFVHVKDPVATPVKKSWGNLKLPGKETSVDGAKVPYGGSHRLTTAQTPLDGKGHNAVVVDFSTPMKAGQPVFAETWCYVVGP